MSESREFPTLDVVSAVNGILVSDRGIAAVYEVLGFLLDDDLMTHQLPAASRAVEVEACKQHPWLADLDPPRGDLPALKAWCAHLVEEHGATIGLTPAFGAEWRGGNALQDLLDIAGDRPVIAVEMPDGDES